VVARAHGYGRCPETLRRLTGPDFAAPVIMTGDDFRFMAMEQATDIGLSDAKVYIEPMARDTAPAILTAALTLKDQPDAMMLVAPSDHVIGEPDAFVDCVKAAAQAAETGALITFGVTPDRPETGYGYLELSGQPDPGKPIALNSFREKPDEATAQAMLDAGNYLWNAGIFLFRVSDILAAFKTHTPNLITTCEQALSTASEDLGFCRLGAEAYANATAISFDYAIMEKAEKVMTVPLSSAWSDLGSWESLWQVQDPDENGVATSGAVTNIDCSNTYLRSEDDNIQLVGLGLDNIVAVAMRDAILVADKSRGQDVKAVVSALRANSVAQADDYPRFHRPWGWYETLCLDTRFQVKRIMVKPGGVLSLQSHHHRSEHWIVVAGTAEVTSARTTSSGTRISTTAPEVENP